MLGEIEGRSLQPVSILYSIYEYNTYRGLPPLGEGPWTCGSRSCQGAERSCSAGTGSW